MKIEMQSSQSEISAAFAIAVAVSILTCFLLSIVGFMEWLRKKIIQ
jgi:hypothetical protein